MATSQPQILSLADVAFRLITSTDESIITLTTALEAELNTLYSAEEREASQAKSESTAQPPQLTYLLAEVLPVESDQDETELGGRLEACGCIAFFFPPPSFFPEHTNRLPPLKVAELTRMYIAPSARRSGLSKALLSQLEKTVRGQYEVDVLTLRTGVRQIPAIRMYEKAGYARRKLYGTYVGGGVEDGGGGVSFSMEKDLRKSKISEEVAVEKREVNTVKHTPMIFDAHHASFSGA